MALYSIEQTQRIQIGHHTLTGFKSVQSLVWPTVFINRGMRVDDAYDIQIVPLSDFKVILVVPRRHL